MSFQDGTRIVRALDQLIPPETVALAPLPGGRISFSAKSCWQLCGEKFNRQYVLMQPGDPATPLIAGSAFHSGQQYAADQQIRGRPRPALGVLSDYVSEAVGMELLKAQREAGRELEWKPGEDLDGLRRSTARGFGTFEREWGHKLEPETIEEYFRLEFENRDYAMTGKLDVWTKAGFVRDYKFTKRAPHATAAAVSDQLTGYQLFKQSQGLEVAGLALDHLVLNKGSERVVIQQVPPRTPEQIAAFFEGVDQVVLGIRAGVFPKVNNWQVCSWCGYLRTCHPDWYELARKGDDNGGN